MLNYDENDKFGLGTEDFRQKNKRCRKLKSLLENSNRFYSTQNVVLLVPMLSDKRNKDIWKCFNEMKGIVHYVNGIVIFYQREKSNTTRKSIEFFLLRPSEYVEIDVQNYWTIWTIKYLDRFPESGTQTIRIVHRNRERR